MTKKELLQEIAKTGHVFRDRLIEVAGGRIDSTVSLYDELKSGGYVEPSGPMTEEVRHTGLPLVINISSKGRKYAEQE